MFKALSRILATIIAVTLSIMFYLKVTADDESNLSATAPSTNTDGSPLTDLALIRVHRAVLTSPNPDCTASSTAWAVLASVPFTEEGGPFSYQDANLTVTGRYCYRLTAVRVNGNESAPSNPAWKDIDSRIPNAPTGVSVN